jgi:transcriptional regulator with XRE-family HTH domain
MPRANPRDPESDPSAAFGESLRDLRTDTGFRIQEDFARATGYARETISRVETGDSLPGPDMLNDWLDACDATGRERKLIERQYKLARKSRGPIPEFIQKWFHNESQAAFLHLWAILLIPGQLQVPGYARAMFLTEGISEDEADEKTDVRMARQARLSGPDAAHATAVIHERALYFQVGTPEVMIAQLKHLVELSGRPNFVIQVIPDAGYFPGIRGPYEIARGDAIPDTLLMLAVEDQTMEDSALTRKAIALFEESRGYALSVADSRAVILEAIEQWKTRQQQ